MRMAQGRWQQQAIATMMRFSRFGHLFRYWRPADGHHQRPVYCRIILSRHAAYGQLLLLKCVLVALMVAIALANRYVLVPRMQQDNRCMTLYFIWMTKIEWGIGAVVLAIVSLFATPEPF